MKKRARSLPVIGWREWVLFPDLAGTVINAKIDTGAKTSALHAMHVREFERDGQTWVAFDVHPLQRNARVTLHAEAPLVEHRKVRSSNGLQSMRPVVLMTIELHGQQWPIELTLTNRDEMGFRMLLGREAFRNRFLVDAGKSYRDTTHVPKRPKRKS